MKNFKKFMLGCALTATILSAGAAANGQKVNGRNDNRQIVGTVVSVDHSERTLEVRDQDTNRIYKVRVPQNAQLRLNKSSAMSKQASNINFEFVMQGFVLDLKVNS